MQSSFVVLVLSLSVLTYTFAADNAILTRVIQEQAMGKAYTSLIMKITHSSYGVQAGGLLSAAAATYLASSKGGEHHVKEEDGDRLRLQGMITAWNENKLATYITILGSEDVQKDYYMDRIVQLQMQTLGNQVPPQLYSFIYMKFYLTYLKTMKFSMRYQFIAHFNTLCEDEIDVMTVVVGKSANFEEIYKAEKPSLNKDKMWVFSTLNLYVQTDLTTFYLQYYLDYMTMALSGQTAGYDMWSKFITLYQTMYLYMAAEHGLRHSVLEKASLNSLSKGDIVRSNEERTAATTFFHNFAECYKMASMIDYMMAFYSMYAMMMPFYAAAAARPVAQAAPAATTP